MVPLEKVAFQTPLGLRTDVVVTKVLCMLPKLEL